jgi:thiamine biosynthesis lipoprotein ApbE
MMADGLATALMVMDAKNGKKLIESMSGFEAYLITKNMEKLVTSSFPNS